MRVTAIFATDSHADSSKVQGDIKISVDRYGNSSESDRNVILLHITTHTERHRLAKTMCGVALYLIII